MVVEKTATLRRRLSRRSSNFTLLFLRRLSLSPLPSTHAFIICHGVSLFLRLVDLFRKAISLQVVQLIGFNVCQVFNPLLLLSVECKGFGNLVVDELIRDQDKLFWFDFLFFSYHLLIVCLLFLILNFLKLFFAQIAVDFTLHLSHFNVSLV